MNIFFEIGLLIVVSLVFSKLSIVLNKKINYSHDYNKWVYIIGLFLGILSYYSFESLELRLLFVVVFITLLSISFIDLKYMEIPYTYVFITIFLGILFMFQVGEYKTIIIALINFTIFLIIALISKALGGGDVNLAFAIGLFFDFFMLKDFYMYTFGVATLVAIILMLIKKADKNIKIPFAPFMAAGAILVFVL